MAADEVKSPRDEAVEQLTATYAKLDGFIARYRYEGNIKGNIKTADITLGMDEASGIGLMHLVGTKAGQKNELKQWSTIDGRIFIDDGNSSKVMDSYQVGFRWLRELQDLVTVPEEQKNPFMIVVPNVVLEKSKVGCGMYLRPGNKPSWMEWIGNSAVKESNDETVTFSSDTIGDLSISRKTGLLVRQKMTGDEGESFALELREVTLNPGQGGVAKMSAAWETKGAKPIDNDMVAAGRRLFFQALINSVEEGEIGLTDFENALERMRDKLERFADSCVMEGKDSLDASMRWDRILNDEQLRKLWMQGIPGANGDEEAFGAFFADAANRRQLRDLLLETLTKDDPDSGKVWERLVIEVFGNGRMGDPRLTTHGKAGEAAKRAIEKFLGRAYFAAVMDRRMEDYWRKRERAAR